MSDPDSKILRGCEKSLRLFHTLIRKEGMFVKMEQTATYQCPNCAAGLTFNPEIQKFICEFCGSRFDNDEVLKANSEEDMREREAADAEYNAQMNEYECKNCGAHIVTDEHSVASFCAYCHNPIVLVGRLSGEMKPQKMIPFRYDKEEAKKRFLSFVKKKWFVPRSFFTPEQVEKITGIYYPFWLTDADTDSRLEAEATNVRKWRSGDVEYTETSYYRIHRAGGIHFEDLTTSANSEEDKKMLEGVLPYPSEALVDFSMPYLSGYAAKKRNLEIEQLHDEVKNRINHYSERILRGTIGHYSSVTVRDSQARIIGSQWEYSLMPVWILTYRAKNGKVYTYAMNGHTGKVFGELPVSKWKLFFVGLLVTAAATLLFTLMGGGLLLS